MITGVVFVAMIAFVSMIVFRLMDRRGNGDPKRVERLEERMARLEGTVESMSSEMERLAEGQRFMTKLLSDRAPSTPRSRPPESEP